ncbi:MAG: DMT family transporter [Desulfococcaceae bacterium]
MNPLPLVLVTFFGGLAATLQPSINARLAQKIGLIESAFVSFLVGTAVLLVIALSTPGGDLRAIPTARWWELTGGFLGALFVATTILAVPRIGTTATMAIIITAQLSMGMLLDHFGLFGLRHIPLDLRRLAGVALLALGVALILRR